MAPGPEICYVTTNTNCLISYVLCNDFILPTMIKLKMNVQKYTLLKIKKKPVLYIVKSFIIYL